MVSSAEALATEAGVSLLQRGGNAVDAAAAVALALGVTEGYSSGIGGGCFILIRMADGTAVCIDGRETAPARATRLMYVPRDTTQPSTLSTEGVLAVATPGELAALELAVRTYGNLPFADSFEGAIAMADTGFAVSMRYARALSTNSELLGRFPGSKAVFFRADGRPLQFRDRLVQSDLANTLRRIQAEGIAAFYAGEIPRKVESYVSAAGGVLTAADFAAYRPVIRDPVRGAYRGCEVLSMPPPSSGGIHVIQILNLLEPFDLKESGAGSSDALHLMAEAMQVAFADRAQYLGDPDFVKIPVAGLLSKDYAAERRALIQRSAHVKLPGAGDPWRFEMSVDSGAEKHTTHLCV
jgi:gamma-glutamyltranspeptidase/glutathione hydrolase